ncbi:MAG: hypothetical protein AB1847_08380 [bacterium]
MNRKKGMKASVLLVLSFIGISALFAAFGTRARAQNWVALPPYNTLWPLWSPVLSPVSTATGLPTPLVTSLTPDTVLPRQPGLTWSPFRRNPWLLYNTPLGMAFYDPTVGVSLWPPRILVNQITGLPITLSLPTGYADLSPTQTSWVVNNVPAANWSYLAAYPSYSTVASTLSQPTITSLLTPTALL